MNLQKREELYIEHMKSVLNQWMTDTHIHLRHGCYPRSANQLSPYQIEEFFQDCKRKLKEFYGVNDITTAYREPEVVKKVKDDVEDIMIVNIDDLELPLKIHSLLMNGLNISKIRDLVKLRSKDLLKISKFGPGKLNRLIYKLDKHGISHNFI